MRAQPPRPFIVRQVSSHAASSGCSLPGSRSPRSPVREGQRQCLPAHLSAFSSPTAQNGMVFAPSASRRQSSPGKTPWVTGGEGCKEQGRGCMGTAHTLEHLSAREPDSGLVHVVVDTPKGSRNKYKYDKHLGLYRLSKVLPLGLAFPYDFGFIPSPQAQDGDPLDVLLLGEEALLPGCLVTVRLVGVLQAEQTEYGKTFRNDRLLGAI